MSGRKSEDTYGEKVDRCMYNALSKFVVGIGVGIVTAAVVRFKPWPIIFGAGIGTGMGISDCNYEFKAGSLTNAMKQSLEGKRTMPAFVAQKRQQQQQPRPSEMDEDDLEMERKEKYAGIVGRTSHLKYYED